MSEFPDRSSARMGIPLLAVLAAMSACDPMGDPAENRATFERCFDTPFTAQAPLHPTTDFTDAIDLNYDESRRTVAEEQTLREDALAALMAAHVTIQSGKYRGSGVLIKAPDGSTVVATVAHNLFVDDRDAVFVRDSQDIQAGVIDGCVVYETDGVPGDLHSHYERPDPETAFQTTDIAILRLDREIGQGALELAEGFPARGTWITAATSQVRETEDNSYATYTASAPAIVDGLVVRNTQGPLGRTVLSGMQPRRSDNGGANGAIQGSSGAGWVNQEARVVALNLSGGQIDNSEDLATHCGVRINGIGIDRTTEGGNALNLYMTSVMPAEDIRVVLTSDRYREDIGFAAAEGATPS